MSVPRRDLVLAQMIHGLKISTLGEVQAIQATEAQHAGNVNLPLLVVGLDPHAIVNRHVLEKAIRLDVEMGS